MNPSPIGNMTSGFNTRAVQDGELRIKEFGNMTTPIFENSTFANPNESQNPATDHTRGKPYMYTRWGNPTLQSLEKKYASLDQVDEALSFSSGMAAITSSLLALLKKGDRLLSVNELYGETFLFFTKTLPAMGINVSFISTDELNSKDIDLRKYNAVYAESIVNPTLGVCDLDHIGSIAAEAGSPLLVDATFASPYNQNPSKFQASVTLHSGTKYIGGHADIILGLAGFSKDYLERIWLSRKTFGGIPDPLQAFLGLRGIKTLGLRMKVQNQNALALARFLEQHKSVRKVFYPGLESFSYHEIAKRNLKGYGGMISFELKDGVPAARKMMKNLKICSSAPSLGGIESLITLPIDTTHGSLTPAERAKMGIPEGLIRLSVGIEDSEDLIDDFQKALA
ncbi:MAG: PLP-dependent transferase [Candidatus Thermoplasmatota archaeon]|nr:PLP-dependent transferase [Candidatus Thermoplasmatota archaeon]MCL5439781.1 PLP-dependent transferase [Candidatus Thermoplasmatota archaeon]